MTVEFDKIPDYTEVPPANNTQTLPTVADELNKSRQLLQQRSTKCKPIRPVYVTQKKKPLKYSYKLLCFCPQYKPTYLCKHVGNIVLDRDVLTKEEHICYLATPKSNFAAPRKQMRCYQKKVILPNCTTRIDMLARPLISHIKWNLETYKSLLTPKQYQLLTTRLNTDAPAQFTDINTALQFIDEERRLRRVAKVINRRNCHRLKKNIIKNQRKQIRKIVCVLFEEMKDFLLNDQFLIDERSTLCAVILDQIINFTEKEFYTTSNLRDYQYILANNLTVWINKFISNLNIQIAPPTTTVERSQPECFLPVKDYIPASEIPVAEECSTSENDYFIDFNEEFEQGDQASHGEDYTESTIKNTN